MPINKFKIAVLVALCFLTSCQVLQNSPLGEILNQYLPTMIPPLETDIDLPAIENTPTPQILQVTPTPSSTTIASTELPPNQSTLEPEQTSVPFLPEYLLQTGSPVFTINFAHPNEGCNWLSVAGQVFDSMGRAQTELVLFLGGTLEDKTIDTATLTGLAPAYGPGGFEIKLSDHPVASSQSLYIQIFDMEGNQLSEKIYFDTKSSCEENIILINFVSQE